MGNCGCFRSVNDIESIELEIPVEEIPFRPHQNFQKKTKNHHMKQQIANPLISPDNFTPSILANYPEVESQTQFSVYPKRNSQLNIIENLAVLSTHIQVPYRLHSFTDSPFNFIFGHGLGSKNPQEKNHDKDNWGKLFVKSIDQIENSNLVYTARGHGTSNGWQISAESNPYQFTWENLSYDMDAMAKFAGFSKYIACGNSMGSATALWTAINFPESVQAVIMIRPPTAWGVRKARRSHLLKSAERLKEKQHHQSQSHPSGEEVDDDSLPMFHFVLKGTAFSDLPEIGSEPSSPSNSCSTSTSPSSSSSSSSFFADPLTQSNNEISESATELNAVETPPPLSPLETEETRKNTQTVNLEYQKTRSEMRETATEGENPRERDLYDRIRCPFLILTIEGDDAHPVSTALALHQRLTSLPPHILSPSLSSTTSFSSSSSSSSSSSPSPSPPHLTPPPCSNSRFCSLHVSEDELSAARDWPGLIQQFIHQVQQIQD